MLHPAQTTIAADAHRFRVLVCGRKFGKTTLASEELGSEAISAAGKRVMYIAPTLQDARRLMWDRLRRLLRRETVRANDTRLELTVRAYGGGTSKIFLGSWELVQNYRGDEFDLIVPDESQDYRNFWLGWQEALRPTLTPRRGAALFMGTPKGFNHLYDLFNLEASDKDFKSFKYTSYDNPFLPREEIEAARRQLTENRFAQEYLADFRKTEGLVYKEFDRNVHLFDFNEKTEDELIIGAHRIAGIDFGTSNPAAVVDIKRDASGTFWVVGEWYQTGKTDAQVAEYAASAGFSKVYPDPASASGVKELENRRVNVGEVYKGPDSIRGGISAIQELLKNKQLRIHRSCTNLIWEFETYAYPEKKDLHAAQENPIDDCNHALDALRYAVTSWKGTINRVAQTYIPPGIARNTTPKVATTYVPKL